MQNQMAKMEAMGRQEEFVTSANNLPKDDVKYQATLKKKPAVISLTQKAVEYQKKYGGQSQTNQLNQSNQPVFIGHQNKNAQGQYFHMDFGQKMETPVDEAYQKDQNMTSCKF